jgi:hypothetical protein
MSDHTIPSGVAEGIIDLTKTININPERNQQIVSIFRLSQQTASSFHPGITVEESADWVKAVFWFGVFVHDFLQGSVTD